MEATGAPAEEPAAEPVSESAVEVVDAGEPPTADEEEGAEPAVVAAVEAEVQVVEEEPTVAVVDNEVADAGE